MKTQSSTLKLVASVFALSCAMQASAANLSTDFNRILIKGSSQLPAENGVTSVTALAVGDFNCDGNDDLAVGDGTSDIALGTTLIDAGSTSIAFGDRFLGFKGTGQKLTNFASKNDDDGFGTSLAAADFDNNGCGDLAIGVPGQDIHPHTDAGGANVWFGTSSGLANPVLMPASNEAAPHGNTGGHFKSQSIVSLNRWTTADAKPYLVMSAHGHAPGGVMLFAGGVAIRRSSGTSILNTPVMFLERGDFPGEFNRFLGFFGGALAAGDFNNDGFDDLVTKSGPINGCLTPTTTPSFCLDNDGAIWIVYGASSISGFIYEKISQASPGVAGVPETNDFFGEVLAVGDFNGDNFDDLAIGIPREDIGTLVDAGLLTILYGNSAGLLANANSSHTFDESAFSGLLSEAGDNFAGALVAGDFNRDGFDDLAIGVPGEDLVNGGSNVGSVIVVNGSAVGITSATRSVFNLDISGASRVNDKYGEYLAAGDFNNDQVTDLAVGIPGKNNVTNTTNKGGIQIIYSNSTTLTSIQSITPSSVNIGQSYTVNVRSRRQNTGGSQLGRGTINVQEVGGGSCVATLSSFGDGSCQITSSAAGLRTVNASYAGLAGYLPSNATPSTLNVIGGVDIFKNGFE